jgi:NAD-dependent dihydropyrimidine dehydrogenase PreA subunit
VIFFFDLEKCFTFAELISTNKKNNKKMAYVISEDCIACGSCISECPVDAIAEGDIYVIDADVCTDCGTCADVCPSEAISPA